MAEKLVTQTAPPPSPYKDVAWAGLFVLNLVIMGGIATVNYDATMALLEEEHANANAEAAASTEEIQIDEHAVGAICLGAIVIAGAWASIWMAIMKAFASCLIWFTMVFSVAMLAVATVAALASGNMLGFLLFALCLVGNIFYIYFAQSRIAFSTEVLVCVTDVVNKFPATVFTALLSIPVQVVWQVVWIFAAVPVITSMDYTQPGTYRDKHTGQVMETTEFNNKALGVLFLLLVSLYWGSQVIKNVVHVTTSGTMATWYFCAEGQTPKNPTLGALKRACTTSFGSICLGSLLIAIIKAIRYIVRELMQREDTHPIIMCCINCVLKCLEDILEFFNLYAFTQVAIYGKGFMEAAKDTWNLFCRVGIEALIQQDLIGGVLAMGCVLGGVITAAACAAWGYTMHLNDAGMGIVMAVGFILGFLMSMLTSVTIESSVATLFVCYAEEPAALQRSHPDLARKFQVACSEFLLAQEQAGDARMMHGSAYA